MIIQIYNNYMNKNIQKYYVEMIVRDCRNGNKVPLYVIWDHHAYKIDKIRSVKQRYSKAGGCGLRYECIIYGKIRYIFLERETKWFIESYHLEE